MAISLARDVITHCVDNGTAVFACSLDAEGAFDALPHSILFAKARSIIQDHFWRFLCSGTASSQGILSGMVPSVSHSQYVKEQDKEDLRHLSSSIYSTKTWCPISAPPRAVLLYDSMNYNVFCYVDDILLTSTTITG